MLADVRPILLVPYMWIGDFVRGHTVVKICKERWPDRPVDVLTSSLCAPLVDYMPGVRKGIVWDLPRRRIAFSGQRQLAARLREENYATALIMPGKWKAALAPALAGIPERIGFVGELRFGLLTDARSGHNRLQRAIDRCAMLALPRNAKLPERWPLPELVVAKQQVSDWLARRDLANEKRPIVALCPGAVGPGKRWPESRYAELARLLKTDGVSVWVVGGPGEKAIANEISAGGKYARELIGDDLRDGVLAIAAADAAVANDSGLLHVAAGIGTPAVGLFGRTSPWHDGPLNTFAAIEAPWRGAEGDFRGRSAADIPVDQVLAAVRKVLTRA